MNSIEKYKNLICQQSILFVLLVGLTVVPASAQTVLQVMTKTIEKSFPYRDGLEVNVEGEKAKISIETWEKDEIYIHLELTSKNPDKELATQDLEAIKYLTDRVKDKIYFRNYISTKEDGGKPTSSLSAVYLIKVPEDCPVYVKDSFGEINVSNLMSRLKILSEYSTVGLQNIQGNIDVRTRFGDIFGEKLNGSMLVNSRRSDITLRDLEGKYDINSQFGIIKIFADYKLIDLNVVAEKSDVFFYNPNQEEYAYNLTANHGNIYTPQTINFEYITNTESLKQLKFKPNSEFYPNVTITVTFGNVTIEKK